MSQVAPQPVGTLSGLESEAVWDTELAYKHLKSCGLADSKRTAERRLHEHSLLPSELNQAALRDEHSRPRIHLSWPGPLSRPANDETACCLHNSAHYPAANHACTPTTLEGHASGCR